MVKREVHMYRNDHDAALARIDALETELVESRAERDRLSEQLADKTPARPKRRLRWIMGGVGVALCGIAIALFHHPPPPDPPAASAPAAYDDPVHRVCALP
jgi:ferric-dicitrate binding protein FerR (iron transport regulator)